MYTLADGFVLIVALHVTFAAVSNLYHNLVTPPQAQAQPQQHIMAPTDKKSTRSAVNDVVTRDYTIHLHKHVRGVQFKKRAPKAVKAIKQFASTHMSTKDIRLDPQLNKEIWKQGIKGVPFRMRLRIARKRNDEEGAKERLYCYVSHVAGGSPKGLQTVVVETTE